LCSGFPEPTAEKRPFELRRVREPETSCDDPTTTAGNGQTEEEMDALALLREDHAKVKELLEKIDATTERARKGRTEGLATLKAELEVHEAIEEEIFYPALKDFAAAKEAVLEAYEEHEVVDTIMGELESTPVDDETWAAKFTVMKENLEHHIEEEEDEMFSQAREVMDQDELDSLGERMQARKDDLMQGVGSA
jgi:iron-sulfur cluster repair protein YtfE (RIC family)